MFFSATVCVPFMFHSTRAVCLSFDTCASYAGSSGERTSLIVWNGLIACRTSLTAARNAGSPIVCVLLCTSTISPIASVCGKPASRRMWSPRWASPTFVSCWSMFFVPMFVPRTTAAMTNASQPKTAVFQWLALQRPMRAARLFDFASGVNSISSLLVRGMSRSLDSRRRFSHRAAPRLEVWKTAPVRGEFARDCSVAERCGDGYPE